MGTETRLRVGYPRNCILIPGRGSRYISSSKYPQRFLKLSGFLFSGYQGCVKRPGRETHHLYPTSAEPKIECYSFPICTHGLHSAKFKSSFEMLRVNGSVLDFNLGVSADTMSSACIKWERLRFQSGC